MTEEKTKRVIVATTVGAVLLIVIMLAIMVYQIIAIQVKKNRIEYLESQIAIYNELIEDGGEIVKARSLEEWIVREAHRLGYEKTR